MYNPGTEESPKIVIDEYGKSYMLETARWAKFLAIIGFVAFGLIMIGLVALMVNMPKMQGELGTYSTGYGMGTVISYAVLIAIFFYPMYALYKFARLVKTAVLTTNQKQFDDAFRYLKNTFKFWGIYTIILLILYGIIIIFALTVAVTTAAV